LAAPRWVFDSCRTFLDVCAKSGKWFHAQENCFVAAMATKQFRAKDERFQRSPNREAALRGVERFAFGRVGALFLLLLPVFYGEKVGMRGTAILQMLLLL
jgi:hypothetical protein